MKKPKSNLTAQNDKEYRAQVKRAQYVINSGYFKKNFDWDIVSARRLVSDLDYAETYEDFIGEYSSPRVYYNELIEKCLSRLPIPSNLIGFIRDLTWDEAFINCNYPFLAEYVMYLMYLEKYTDYDTSFFRAMVAIYRKHVIYDIIKRWIVYGCLPENIIIEDVVEDRCMYKNNLEVECELNRDCFDVCVKKILQ